MQTQTQTQTQTQMQTQMQTQTQKQTQTQAQTQTQIQIQIQKHRYIDVQTVARHVIDGKNLVAGLDTSAMRQTMIRYVTHHHTGYCTHVLKHTDF